MPLQLEAQVHVLHSIRAELSVAQTASQLAAKSPTLATTVTTTTSTVTAPHGGPTTAVATVIGAHLHPSAQISGLRSALRCMAHAVHADPGDRLLRARMASLTMQMHASSQGSMPQYASAAIRMAPTMRSHGLASGVPQLSPTHVVFFTHTRPPFSPSAALHGLMSGPSATAQGASIQAGLIPHLGTAAMEGHALALHAAAVLLTSSSAAARGSSGGGDDVLGSRLPVFLLSGAGSVEHGSVLMQQTRAMRRALHAQPWQPGVWALAALTETQVRCARMTVYVCSECVLRLRMV